MAVPAPPPPLQPRAARGWSPPRWHVGTGEAICTQSARGYAAYCWQFTI